MKQILLALLLTAVPVTAFTGYQFYMGPAPVQAAAGKSLGDLTALSAIVADVTTITKSGDMVKAEKRITEFETAWDDAEATMHPLNAEAWGFVDSAADHALKALRAGTPDPAKVSETLLALTAALANPTPKSTAGGVIGKVAGIDVTDANGHAIPCETMLKSLQTLIADGKISPDKMAAASDFATKATERCNADDDTNADAFSAQGVALATK
jgi:hypothetical protein